jgi:hypothetical protein
MIPPYRFSAASSTVATFSDRFRTRLATILNFQTLLSSSHLPEINQVTFFGTGVVVAILVRHLALSPQKISKLIPFNGIKIEISLVFTEQ